jgi:hypothetical protein
MKERIVRVRFEGEVKVLVADCVSDADADVLAAKLVLAKIVAQVSVHHPAKAF